MARIPLFPRLNPAGVDSILERAGSGRPPQPRYANEALADIQMVSFAASGGGRDSIFIDSLGTAIREHAENQGFPLSTSEAKRSVFDTEVSKLLGVQSKLQTGEGLRDDVWAFLTTVVVPDVVGWRFPDMAVERFHGGIRNALQRLWIRGNSLDLGEGRQDRWIFLEELTEDAMVQIFERASLSSEPRLAQAISASWLRTVNDVGRSRMERVMRSAVKLIRLRNEIVDLGAVSTEECRRQVDELFQKAVDIHLNGLRE